MYTFKPIWLETLVQDHPEYRDVSTVAILDRICNPKGGNQEFKGRNLKNLVAIAAKS